ncbi:hypothetical protein MLD38_001343 [Melastoma candidum]|uniref:Uncharacterized protein n=1 Tax=Melastoma candidum TaxID=119954 RepID=A0ACB9SDC6_9MYRT|nr:hypothetical protein MLD38_001343 [Melastoma candidum]
MVRNVQFANSSSAPGPTDDNPDFVPVNRGCCFWIPFLSRPSAPSLGETTTWWGSTRVSEQAYGSTEGPWWSRGWRRLRDAFNRRFSRGQMMMRRGGSQFRYDPLSYALNFDEGPGQNGEQLDRDMLSRDFSSRYASIPASCKSSMDLGHSGPLFM